MTHYNTTNETGETLATMKRKAQSQEDKILKYFEAHPEGLFSASHIWSTLYASKQYKKEGLITPIQSIRRAITNLIRS